MFLNQVPTFFFCYVFCSGVRKSLLGLCISTNKNNSWWHESWKVFLRICFLIHFKSTEFKFSRHVMACLVWSLKEKSTFNFITLVHVLGWVLTPQLPPIWKERFTISVPGIHSNVLPCNVSMQIIWNATSNQSQKYKGVGQPTFSTYLTVSLKEQGFGYRKIWVQNLILSLITNMSLENFWNPSTYVSIVICETGAESVVPARLLSRLEIIQKISSTYMLNMHSSKDPCKPVSWPGPQPRSSRLTEDYFLFLQYNSARLRNFCLWLWKVNRI